MKNELISLLTVKNTTDENGFSAEEKIASGEIFAKVKSVRSTEFYDALRSNIKLQYMYSVNYDDYAEYIKDDNGRKILPGFVEYEGNRYKIVRTYKKDDGDIELSCEEVE